jgi:hypothetical protein
MPASTGSTVVHVEAPDMHDSSDNAVKLPLGLILVVGGAMHDFSSNVCPDLAVDAILAFSRI